MAPAFGNKLSNETEKLNVLVKVKPFYFIFFPENPMHFILSNNILWSKLLKAYWTSIKIMPVNFSKHVSGEWFALKPDW